MDTITALMASEEGGQADRRQVRGGRRFETRLDDLDHRRRRQARGRDRAHGDRCGECRRNRCATTTRPTASGRRPSETTPNRRSSRISARPRWRKLENLVDPYFYRDRLTMPKFIMNASGDQFFLPDSSQFYFADLTGDKYLRYVPNADHSLDDTDAVESLLAFYLTVLHNKPRPVMSWTFEEDGAIRVRLQDARGQGRPVAGHQPGRTRLPRGNAGQEIHELGPRRPRRRCVRGPGRCTAARAGRPTISS